MVFVNSALAVAILALHTLAVPAAPSATEVVEEQPPLPVGQMGWIGQLSEDGPEETWWGDDLDDIDAQIRNKHPGLSIFDGSLDFGNNTKSWSDDVLVEGELQAQQDTRMICNNFGQVFADGIGAGISHLRTVSGGCAVRARQCIRTTCHRFAAIALCNDRHQDLRVSCSLVADMAFEIMRSCRWFTPRPGIPGGPPSLPPVYIVSGQRFHKDGWNVIAGMCERFSPKGQPV